jgi:hypothetical protein
MKCCSKCKESKDVSFFCKRLQGSVGICSDCKKEYQKKYREKHRHNFSVNNKEYYRKNRDKLLEYNKLYREKNKEQLRIKSWEYVKNRKAFDVLYAFKLHIRGTVSKALLRSVKQNYATSEIESYIGCSLLELRTYIESKFEADMSWENRGKLWHLGHITPLYTAKDENEARKLFHYTNLRPEYAKRNLIKNKKTDEEYKKSGAGD